MTDNSGLSDALTTNSGPLPSSAYPEHPRPAVGAVVFHARRVLLVKRGRPPGQGRWSLPGGNVRLGETLQQAAEREVFEETGIVIRARQPVYTFDLVERDSRGRVRFHYVIVDLSADYIRGDPLPADDAAEARWASSADLESLGVHSATRDLLRRVFGFG